MGGKVECIIGKTDSSILEVITRVAHDHELLTFNPPMFIPNVQGTVNAADITVLNVSKELLSPASSSTE